MILIYNFFSSTVLYEIQKLHEHSSYFKKNTIITFCILPIFILIKHKKSQLYN